MFDINLSHGFIFHVGGNQWCKNRIGVCKIYEKIVKLRSASGQSSLPLVLAGSPPSAELLEFTNRHNELQIIYLISPTNDVNALYSLASLLLFPSIVRVLAGLLLRQWLVSVLLSLPEESQCRKLEEIVQYINPCDIQGAARISNDTCNGILIKDQIRFKWAMHIKRFNRMIFFLIFISI